MLSEICQIALQAGSAIMEVYDKTQIGVEYKADRSPLTEADRSANDIICSALDKSFGSIPILSEENKAIEYAKRAAWSEFWLVDPLDGTKEFLKKTSEFTVNIALIKDRKPVLGVVFAPALNVLYYAESGKAWKKDANEAAHRILIRNAKNNLIAVASRSHSSPEEQDLFAKIGVTETIASGSSLKFCLVAEGKADLYYRHGPTSEWDTAAGQCVVECAGGLVMDRQGPLLYNKTSLLNPSFLAKGSPELDFHF